MNNKKNSQNFHSLKSQNLKAVSMIGIQIMILQFKNSNKTTQKIQQKKLKIVMVIYLRIIVTMSNFYKSSTIVMIILRRIKKA